MTTLPATPAASQAAGRAPGVRRPRAALALVLLALAAPAPAAPPPLLLGINLEGTSDWEPMQMWADLARQGRPWGSVAAPHDGKASRDADGWPTEDAGIVLAVNPPHSTILQAGVYRLSFTGQARAIETRNSSQAVKVSAPIYHPATNTTEAEVTVAKGDELWLTFTGTRRTKESALGSGLTNLRLLRPGHGEGELFSRDFLQRAGHFKLIRFMQYQGQGGQGINANQDIQWSERTRPSSATYQRENGAPLEHAVALANRLGASAWIQIPLLADDDYVTRVAQLLRFGSDGVNPYTSPQARPAFAPLQAGLTVYVEYVNELWNGTYRSSWTNQALARDEYQPVDWRPHTAYRPPDWEGVTSGVVRNAGGRYLCTTAGTSGATGPTGLGRDIVDGTARWRRLDAPPSEPDAHRYFSGSAFELGMRRQARRTLEISGLFRAVWGDAAMGKAVRVVVAGQHGNMGTFSGQLDYLARATSSGPWYNKSRTPLAVHVHALASAPYLEVRDERSDRYTADQVIAEMAQRAQSGDDGELARMGRFARKAGLAWLAYEGGAGNLGGHSDAAKLAAQSDPRMRTQVIVPWLRGFYAAGGELFTYYTICKGWAPDSGGYFGLSTDIADESTPKWQAVLDVAGGR